MTKFINPIIIAKLPVIVLFASHNAINVEIILILNRGTNSPEVISDVKVCDKPELSDNKIPELNKKANNPIS